MRISRSDTLAATTMSGSSVIKIIKRDWTMQRDECSQERWESLIRTGLIKQAAVELMADQVWPSR